MQPGNFFSFLQSSSVAILIDGSRYIAMAIQIVHLLALTFLLALVLAFNIRVLRFSLRGLRVDLFARVLLKPYLITLAIAAGAGILLFLPRAEIYGSNVPFVWKMSLLVLAGAGQLVLLRHLSKLDPGQEAPFLFRAGSLLTLLLWISTGVAGRAIGFV